MACQAKNETEKKGTRFKNHVLQMTYAEAVYVGVSSPSLLTQGSTSICAQRKMEPKVKNVFTLASSNSCLGKSEGYREPSAC